MGEHTKGPWVCIPQADCRSILIATQHKYGCGIAEVWIDLAPYAESAEANARLIASAPELLEALERVVKLDAHGCLTRDCPHKTGRECAEELATVLAEMIDRARYAIAKARGEG